MKKLEQRRQIGPSQGYLLKLGQKGPLCKPVSGTSKAKKLVLVLATFALVTSTSKKAPDVVLDWILFIHYLVQFQNDREEVTI